MTYDPSIPNASQSPGLFPPQNNANFTRLKTIINADHVFNDTAQATDGVHRQVTFVNRAVPVAVPAGTNSMVYGFTAADTQNDLWFYNSSLNNQLNWRELTGTVAITASFTNIVAIPANCYGYVYLYRDFGATGVFISAGTFASNNSLTNGFSYAEKFIAGSSATQLIRLGFSGDGASGLFLRGRNDNSSSFNGLYTYKVFYRLM